MGGTKNIQHIQVSGIAVNEKELPVDSVLKAGLLELGPGNISIRALFSTNSFQNSLAMYYMLEDMDKAWKPAPSSGELNLNYLPPGHYVLKAAILDEHNNVISIQTIPILIRPPFYRAWWFYILLAIGLLTGLFLLDRQRMKRKEEVHKMRTDIAEKLHHEVNAALGNINILSEMALLKADEEPLKAKEFVEQIQDKSSATLTAVEDMLWAITPGNDSMEMATARMQEFLQGISNRNEARIEMVIDERLRNIRFDMQWRYEAFLLFKESINGLLQAGVKTCRVHIGYDKPELTFLLQFPNAGCDMQQLNNYFQGRKMAERVEGLHARLHVVVHKSNTEIECFIPSMLN
jgi:signal transduction histidine kinase